MNPCALAGIDDVHEFGANGAAVGLTQRVVNLSQGRLIFADVQAASLEYRVKIGFAELMVLQLQIRYSVALPEVQRIELSLLMTALAIGTDQLNNANLLALVVTDFAAGRRGGTHRLFGQMGKVVTNWRVGNIANRGFADTGELLKIISPFFGNGIGISEIGFIQVFNVTRIATRYMGALPKKLH